MRRTRFEQRGGLDVGRIHERKGGDQRLLPVSTRFFRSLARYLELERRAVADPTAVFVELKELRRGQPLSADGLDQIVRDARARAGLAHCSCHELDLRGRPRLSR